MTEGRLGYLPDYSPELAAETPIHPANPYYRTPSKPFAQRCAEYYKIATTPCMWRAVEAVERNIEETARSGLFCFHLTGDMLFNVTPSDLCSEIRRVHPELVFTTADHDYEWTFTEWVRGDGN